LAIREDEGEGEERKGGGGGGRRIEMRRVEAGEGEVRMKKS